MIDAVHDFVAWLRYRYLSNRLVIETNSVPTTDLPLRLMTPCIVLMLRCTLYSLLHLLLITVAITNTAINFNY